MITDALIDNAIKHNEWNTVIFILDSIAGEYLEGYIESAKDRFNNLFNKLPLEYCDTYAELTVFSCIRKLCETRIDRAVCAAESLDEG